jgi:ribosomal protein L11 methyltransferase
MPSYVVEILVPEDQKDFLLADLMDAGTTGVSETESSHGHFLLRASFETREQASAFGNEVEVDDTDWVSASHRPWASRLVGQRFFFAPAWSEEPTPDGRWRIAYQDGAACGSGDHPSTRQCLEAIEEFLKPGMRVLDIGCGAGLLSYGAKLLGASFVVGVDIEADSCTLSRNLAGVPVVQGSANAIQGEFDLVVANVSASVLLDLADEILRLAKPGSRLILGGFGVEEAHVVRSVFATGPVSERIESYLSEEWSCLVLDIPSLDTGY